MMIEFENSFIKIPHRCLCLCVLCNRQEAGQNSSQCVVVYANFHFFFGGVGKKTGITWHERGIILGGWERFSHLFSSFSSPRQGTFLYLPAHLQHTPGLPPSTYKLMDGEGEALEERILF